MSALYEARPEVQSVVHNHSTERHSVQRHRQKLKPIEANIC